MKVLFVHHLDMFKKKFTVCNNCNNRFDFKENRVNCPECSATEESYLASLELPKKLSYGEVRGWLEKSNGVSNENNDIEVIFNVYWEDYLEEKILKMVHKALLRNDNSVVVNYSKLSDFNNKYYPLLEKKIKSLDFTCVYDHLKNSLYIYW